MPLVMVHRVLKAQRENLVTTVLQEKRVSQDTMELPELQANPSSDQRANLAIMAPLAFLEVLDYPAKTAILAALDLLDQRETLVPQALLFHPKSLDLRAPQDTMAKMELLATQGQPDQLAQLDLKDLKDLLVIPEQTVTLVALDQREMPDTMEPPEQTAKMVILVHQAKFLVPLAQLAQLALQVMAPLVKMVIPVQKEHLVKMDSLAPLATQVNSEFQVQLNHISRLS